MASWSTLGVTRQRNTVTATWIGKPALLQNITVSPVCSTPRMKAVFRKYFFCLEADHVLTDQTECNRTTCLVLISFSDFPSYPNPWVGMPNADCIFLGERCSVLWRRSGKRVALIRSAVPALFAVVWFPAQWVGPHLACRLPSPAEFCTDGFPFQITDKSFSLESVQKEWQCFYWGENRQKRVGLMEKDDWGSWNKKQCPDRCWCRTLLAMLCVMRESDQRELLGWKSFCVCLC